VGRSSTPIAALGWDGSRDDAPIGAAPALAALALAACVCLLLCARAQADINPWVASNLYDPEKWDTAGPYTGTPWLHPPTWTTGQNWGVLSGNWRTTAALTGSWGGARDTLARRGIQILGGYFGQLAANPVGGERQGASWKGDASAAVFLDLQRLVGWHRGYFTASFAYKNPSDSLSFDDIGNQFPVQLDSGDDNGASRLVHLAVGQQLFDNTSELVAGRLIAGEDFASIRLACTSLNQAICGNPIAAAQSISFPTYPSATWGGRFKIKPESSWYAQTGAYLVYPDFRDSSDHGVEFGAPDGSGVLALGEFGYLVGKDGGQDGLPGKYKIGGYYDTEQLTDLDSGEGERGTWGIYGMAEHMLYSENDQYSEGLLGFLSLSYAPPDLNRVQFMVAGGLSYQGAVAGRPDDSLSLVGAYGLFSDDLPGQNGETLLELNYRVQIAPWVFVQPDLQYIIDPDGRSDVDNALVLGFALGVAF
jgi:porin